LVSEALGVSDQSTRDQVAVLAEFLADRTLLLLVDNCEHLLPAVAQLMVELMDAAPGLRVLATSREQWQVAGERVYPVRPLPAPAAGRSLGVTTGGRYPAVMLFADRAAAVYQTFAVDNGNVGLVAEICQRLAGPSWLA